MTFRFGWLVAAIVATGGPAIADQQFGIFHLPDADPRLIIMRGEIELGSPADFDRAVEARPAAPMLILDSPGGRVVAGLAIANHVADRGMSTVIDTGSGCYSACAFVFFAGQVRIAMGELGVHQVSGTNDISAVQSVVSDIYEALNRFGTPDGVVSLMLRTPPEDMHIFSAAEIASLAVNRLPADPSTGQPAAKASPPSFTVITNYKFDEWMMTIYHNNKSGRTFCAFESVKQEPLFRINSYIDGADNFVELFSPDWKRSTGKARLEFTFVSKKRASKLIKLYSDGWGDSYTYDLIDAASSKSIREAMSASATMEIRNDGEILATYDLRGSSQSANAFDVCLLTADQ